MHSLRNNIIAIIAISFIVVGSLWGVGNLLSNSSNQTSASTLQGIILIAENNAFNDTNPDIHAKAGVPLKLVIINKDFVRHDFIVDKLNINTAYLRTEQDFTTAIASQNPGTFGYYCSLHPAEMRGKVIISP